MKKLLLVATVCVVIGWILYACIKISKGFDDYLWIQKFKLDKICSIEEKLSNPKEEMLDWYDSDYGFRNHMPTMKFKERHRAIYVENINETKIFSQLAFQRTDSGLWYWAHDFDEDGKPTLCDELNRKEK